MIKSQLLGFVIFQVICKISVFSEAAAIQDNPVDTETPRLTLVSVQEKNVPHETSLTGDCSGHYTFHATNVMFNLNGPTAKNPMGFGSTFMNVDKELNSNYIQTPGIGAHKLHTRKLTWNRARKTCTEEGGHLVVIRTDSEEKIILQMMVDDGIEDAWIGLHDKFEEGEWVSVMDEPLAGTGWTKWSSGNPDNYQGKQHCARIIKKGIDDDNCDVQKAFVCKITRF